ncbi:MAG: acyl-CoA dehydrogenase family protein [Actinobacteria bacterium]|nr:acyl-CoA dehydrogenase family protein [Actinomycetota bacterium]MBU1609658.1 acyl-CoA dehydrogenase family protein [Actinomycetota bacterium]MBU2314859.1 acyl-CoA dehydrogenase family protein [Actinomycetota bacterium]MBU2385201.1 acyl-CoA dehydrogenase family protein [Actinomycetota bacterium]
MATRESSVREPRTGDAPVAEHTEPAQPAPAAPVSAQRVEEEKTEGSAPQLDVAALGEQLMGRWAESRRASRELMRREEFHRMPTDDMDAQRERVLGQLGLLVDQGSVHRAFPKEFGGEDDHGGFIASFEELLLGDPSMQIKSGVQWGLYASAILHLGTQPHHRAWLPDALDLSTPGAFAMTETGHGSDVSAVGTTATYDEASDEWIIHTPFRAAWKDYLGNAALHGRAAVVFAQLITRGVNHGVHAFYVPLRDESGAFLPGIGGEDDGLKGGLNGIDNGRLHFTQVRVPRTNLLNRYGSVDENGVYTSPITSPGRRFFTMLGTLVQGRVSLDGACVVASKLATTIAVRYGSERRQFDDGDDNEVVLLDYQRHQRRLLPRLAQTYAMSFAHEVFLEKFDGVFSGRTDTDSDREDLETLAAALKPLSTWAALDIIQEAREACGGQGFLAANRLTQLRADLDIYATFEGDNNVLLQLVAKRLLTDYSRTFAKADAGVMAHYVADQVNEAVVHRSGLRRLVQSVADFGSTARSVGYVRDTASQRQLLTDRVETMVAELAGKLRSASKLPKKDAAALFNRHQNALIETAKAHGELLQWEAFTEALARVEHEGNRQVLTWLRDLFGLGLIEKNLAWYVIHGRLSDHRAQAITDYIDDRLLPRLRPHALELTDAFELRDEHIRADIATGEERARQEEAREYYASLRARGLAPIDEKDLLAAKKKRAG